MQRRRRSAGGRKFRRALHTSISTCSFMTPALVMRVARSRAYESHLLDLLVLAPVGLVSASPSTQVLPLLLMPAVASSAPPDIAQANGGTRAGKHEGWAASKALAPLHIGPQMQWSCLHEHEPSRRQSACMRAAIGCKAVTLQR